MRAGSDDSANGNRLYLGDSLDVLWRHIEDETVEPAAAGNRLNNSIFSAATCGC
jgi:hypothetical protein